MERRVEVRVDPDGSVHTEFVGFLGDQCMEAAEEMRRVLKSYGLSLECVHFHEKAPEELAQEVPEGVWKRSKTRLPQQ